MELKYLVLLEEAGRKYWERKKTLKKQKTPVTAGVFSIFHRT